MENKLSQAKNEIAKEYGYDCFDELLNSPQEISQQFLNKVAIRYNELCNAWVSVDARLPKDNQHILFYINDEIKFGLFVIKDTFDRENIFICDGIYRHSEVSYWKEVNCK